jgi:hypothetical protein
MDRFKIAYAWHKKNAHRRGIEFLFTLEDWSRWWLDTGKWEQRGTGKDRYCMCRFGDTGPYAPWNVYCATNGKNLSDAHAGKPKSAEQRRKMSEANKGKRHPWASGAKNPMHLPETKAKMSAAIGGGKHYKARMVGTPHGIWTSATECAKAIGIPIQTVNWRCKHNKLGFAYLT